MTTTTTTAVAAPDISELMPDGTHLIGGEWVPARAKATIDVINPATGDVLARVPRGTAEDIDDAVRAAADALPGWRDTNPSDRGGLLYRWAQLAREHDATINRLEAIEVGHPVGPSPIVRRLTYLAGKADKVFGLTLPTSSPDVLGLTLREPYGSIIPWNAPGPFTIFSTAPAIAAGNTVVLKPGEDAPLTALYLARLAMEAGIPPGVINVVTGYGAEAGAALPAHPGIRKMSFTGSPATGTAVMEACARNLIPLQLELGGKSPQIVLADADLGQAVRAIVRGIVANSGQVCAAGSRVLVSSSVHDDLVSALAERFRAVRVGPWNQPVDMGPLINAKQEQRVLDYLAVGREEGAEVLVGGGKLAGEPYENGYFIGPTIFDRVRPDMRIAQEEIFGPVLSVLTYDDEDEAIALANGTRYGLTATVWTRDVGRAIRMARRIQAGRVAVNTFADGGVISAPFGGYKDSGFGRSMGPDFVEDWTQVKTVVFNVGD
jgi:aldehyde dehydrogenase (NAD+)